MNLQDIINEWTKDAVLDDLCLDVAALDISKLHAKYLSILSNARMKHKYLQIKKRELVHELRIYYSGRADQLLLTKLNRLQFQTRILRSELDDHIDSDSAVIQLDASIMMHQEHVSVLDEIIKSLNARNYAIKSAIDWKKFIGGV